MEHGFGIGGARREILEDSAGGGKDHRPSEVNLEEAGFPPHLLSGDSEKTTATVAGPAGVAMVGDGLEDRPSLAQADVGIAMAGGEGRL